MNDFKEYLVNIMAPGDHKHESITEAQDCPKCKPKILKAWGAFQTVKREKPELLIRPKPQFKPSEELTQMRGQLGDRLQRDKLYQRHIRLSFKGTPAESKREEERANSGFYKKHSDYQGVQYL